MFDLTQACKRTADVLMNVTDDQLNGPTPCEKLSLGDLVAHVGGLAPAFTAAEGPVEGLFGPAVAVADDAPRLDRIVADRLSGLNSVSCTQTGDGELEHVDGVRHRSFSGRELVDDRAVYNCEDGARNLGADVTAIELQHPPDKAGEHFVVCDDQGAEFRVLACLQVPLVDAGDRSTGERFVLAGVYGGNLHNETGSLMEVQRPGKPVDEVVRLVDPAVERELQASSAQIVARRVIGPDSLFGKAGLFGY